MKVNVMCLCHTYDHRLYLKSQFDNLSVFVSLEVSLLFLQLSYLPTLLLDGPPPQHTHTRSTSTQYTSSTSSYTHTNTNTHTHTVSILLSPLAISTLCKNHMH